MELDQTMMIPENRTHKNFVDEEKEYDDAERSIVHVISDESIDRMGDIVRAKGMDDASYSQNPIVLYGHDYHSFPVGKNLWRKVVQRNGIKAIRVKTQFAPTDEGKMVYELWKGGYLNASSIGFRPKEGGWEFLKDEEGNVTGYDFKDWELLEYSIVPVPANANATRELISKGLVTNEKVKKILEESILEQENRDYATRIEEMQKAQETANQTIEMLTACNNSLQLEITELKKQIPEPKPENIVRTLTSDEIREIADRVFRQKMGKE